MRALMVDYRSGRGRLQHLKMYGFGSEILKSHIRDRKTHGNESRADEVPLSTFIHRGWQRKGEGLTIAL